MQFSFEDKRVDTCLIRECPTCDWKRGKGKGKGKGEYWHQPTRKAYLQYIFVKSYKWWVVIFLPGCPIKNQRLVVNQFSPFPHFLHQNQAQICKTICFANLCLILQKKRKLAKYPEKQEKLYFNQQMWCALVKINNTFYISLANFLASFCILSQVATICIDRQLLYF